MVGGRGDGKRNTSTPYLGVRLTHLLWGKWLQATGLFIHPSKEGGGGSGGSGTVETRGVWGGGVVDEVVVVG